MELDEKSSRKKLFVEDTSKCFNESPMETSLMLNPTTPSFSEAYRTQKAPKVVSKKHPGTF